MPGFFQTMIGRGRRFYEKDVVVLIEQLKKIANEMELANELSHP
ncbi:hypothetical protein ABE073_02795 [Lederbergia citrisecunda]